MSYARTTQQFLCPSTIRNIKKNQPNQLIDDFKKNKTVSKRFFFTERGQFAINLKKMQAKTRRVSEFVF